MSRIVGIDPGLDGALAVLPDGLTFDTPTAEVKSGRTKRRVYQPAQMVRMLATCKEDYPDGVRQRHDVHVYLEAVHSMPGQGVRSMFSMGHGLGLWMGILAALEIPYTLIEPTVWKRAMVGLGKDKDASRIRAQQLFPASAGDLARKKDHGRAEALLIAEFGRRSNGH